MTVKKKEPKNVFQHIGSMFGSDDKKTKTQTDRKSLFDIFAIKKLAISFFVFAAIGYVIGMIIDIFLEMDKFAMALSLVFILLWLLKTAGHYLRK